MNEGWYGDDYLVLFEEKAPSLEKAYGLVEALPGYRLVGLRGWDDFIVEDTAGARFTVPTVPLLPRYLKPFGAATTQSDAAPDDPTKGRIKWNITPIIFGGDPKLGDNVRWVTLDEHAQLVKWWNTKYRETREGIDGMPAA
jgi:hypothetical protein